MAHRFLPLRKNRAANEKIKENILKLNELEKRMIKEMTEDEKQYFEDYSEITDEMYSELLADAFDRGFKLGARLIKEALEP
ncbi:MAG: hypothetical protein IJW19_08615 [Clostridia bacterium]|nr:hypothetical protein [Clostridia bacterium]